MTGRHRKAFTLTELVVVLLLASIVLVMVATGMSTFTTTTIKTVDRAQSRSEIRDVLDTASRALRGASPVERCADTPPATSTLPNGDPVAPVLDDYVTVDAAGCNRIVTVGSALQEAGPTSVTFLSYSDPNACTGDSPELVIFDAGGTDVTLRRFCANDSSESRTEIDPATSFDTDAAPAFSMVVSGLSNVATGTPLLRYLDSGGDEIAGSGPDGTLTDDELASVALIKIEVRSDSRNAPAGRGQRLENVGETTVALPGARYDREASWSGG